MNSSIGADLLRMTQYMQGLVKACKWKVYRVGKGKEMSHWQTLDRHVHVSVYPEEILIYVKNGGYMILHECDMNEAIKRIKRKFKLDR